MLPGVVASAVAYSSHGLNPVPTGGCPRLADLHRLRRRPGAGLRHRRGGETFDPAPRTSYDVMVAGLHPVAAVVEQPAQQAGVQLALHPLAAPAVLGCRAAELVGVGDHGHEVLGEVAASSTSAWPVRRRRAALDVVQHGSGSGSTADRRAPAARSVARAWSCSTRPAAGAGWTTWPAR